MSRYVVASSKDWFKKHPKSSAYEALDIVEIDCNEDLNLKILNEISPRYIFFPHWNWRVNSEIYERFECVVFHTAPLPFGRGGSPIQNLIIRGYERSPVCALRMTDVLDGGPIYATREVSLGGTINEIFSRIACSVESLIVQLCETEPDPVEQTGEVVAFNRLTIEDNELHPEQEFNEIYDRIRMVDGLDYPRAYVNWQGYKLEFSGAEWDGKTLCAQVRFIRQSKS